jgi:hypothetical protein
MPFHIPLYSFMCTTKLSMENHEAALYNAPILLKFAFVNEKPWSSAFYCFLLFGRLQFRADMEYTCSTCCKSMWDKTDQLKTCFQYILTLLGLWKHWPEILQTVISFIIKIKAHNTNLLTPNEIKINDTTEVVK